MVLTGADGELQYRAQRCAKVTSWSLTVTRDTIDDSCLGQFDRTYITGLRTATGTANILYDPKDQKSRQLLNTIFDNKAKPEEVNFVLNTTDGRAFDCNCILSSVTATVEVGSAHAVSVNFQVSGEIEGRF